MSVWLAGESEADELLARDPLALLVGLLLDQQVPMERAFRGPYTILTRLAEQQGHELGADPHLDAVQIAGYDPERLAAVFSTPPAVHRYPAAMAERVQSLCGYVSSEYGGDAAAVWREAADGRQLRARARALPGYGAQKAAILAALLGKQFGVQPPGWRKAAGAYGEAGSRLSIADVTGPDELAEVRACKKAVKAGKAGTAGKG